jgi:hypothetical protein
MKRISPSEGRSALHADSQHIYCHDKVPDGLYWTEVENVDLEVPQSSGAPRFICKLRILGPNHYGRQIQRDLMVRQDTFRWLTRDMDICGFCVRSFSDLSGCLDNLLNLKLRVRQQGESVHILSAEPISAQGRLFLHLIDLSGNEYLDQQVPSSQHPKDEEDFEELIDYFVNRYHCPRPYKAYLEDAKTGTVLFSMEDS